MAKTTKAAEAAPSIYDLLPKVAKAIGAIGKGKRNDQQGYNFRGIEDVVNAAHPAFTEHGVFVTSEVIEQDREQHSTRNGGALHYSILRVKFTFYAPDGSSVSSTTVGEGMDSGDKASNKAMSAALKYALGQTFLIPFDLKDSEDDNPERGDKRSVILQFKDKKPVYRDLDTMTADELTIALDCAKWRGENAKGKYAEKNKAEARADWKAIKAEMATREQSGEPASNPETDPIPTHAGMKAEKKQPADMSNDELSRAYDAAQLVLADEFSTNAETEAATIAIERLEVEMANRATVDAE